MDPGPRTVRRQPRDSLPDIGPTGVAVHDDDGVGTREAVGRGAVGSGGVPGGGFRRVVLGARRVPGRGLGRGALGPGNVPRGELRRVVLGPGGAAGV